MDIPYEIVSDYERSMKVFPPMIAIRALSDTNYRLGETYLFGGSSEVLMYSGILGEKKHRIDLLYSEIHKISARNESPYVYLYIESGDVKFKMKFAQYDLEKVKTFIGIWQQSTDPEEVARPTEIQPESDATPAATRPDRPQLESDLIPELTMKVGLSAALHAMIYIDDEAVAREVDQFNLIINDPELKAAGLTYFRYKGAMQLIDELAALYDATQKRCLLANLIEIALVDRKLKPEEYEFIQYICKAFGIGQEELGAMYALLLLKNNLAVFEG